MKFAYISEPVSKAGLFVVKETIARLKKEFQVQTILVQADSITNGFGLGKNHALYLRKMGADLLIGADQVFYKKDLVESFSAMNFILRPANLPFGSPGRGWKSLIVNGIKIAVVSLLGQSGYHRSSVNNPVRAALDLLERISKDHPVVIVDFHALTTAEKQIMRHALDGKIQVLIGSGTGVASADCHISEQGMGYITDVGRSGSLMSVGGFMPQIEIEAIKSGVPKRSEDCWDGLQGQGLLFDISEAGQLQEFTWFSFPFEKKSAPADGAN